MSEREIIEIGKWLNTKGYDIEFDKDGFWWEEWRWGEHTTKDVIELIYDYNKSKLNKLHIADVSVTLPLSVIDIKDIKRVRNYFGENDITTFEHFAYSFINRLLNRIKQ